MLISNFYWINITKAENIILEYWLTGTPSESMMLSSKIIVIFYQKPSLKPIISNLISDLLAKGQMCPTSSEPPQPYHLPTLTAITLLHHIASTVDGASLVKHHPRAKPISKSQHWILHGKEYLLCILSHALHDILLSLYPQCHTVYHSLITQALS